MARCCPSIPLVMATEKRDYDRSYTHITLDNNHSTKGWEKNTGFVLESKCSVNGYLIYFLCLCPRITIMTFCVSSYQRRVTCLERIGTSFLWMCRQLNLERYNFATWWRCWQLKLLLHQTEAFPKHKFRFKLKNKIRKVTLALCSVVRRSCLYLWCVQACKLSNWGNKHRDPLITMRFVIKWPTPIVI